MDGAGQADDAQYFRQNVHKMTLNSCNQCMIYRTENSSERGFQSSAKASRQNIMEP
jgi:ribosome-binding protein aMBF1 (putative translation factor)